MDFEKYFKNIVKLDITSETDDEIRAKCPLHNDEVTSFSCNKKSGLFKCFSASCKGHTGGNIYQFHNLMFPDIPIGRCEKDIKMKLGLLKSLPYELIEKHYQILLASKPVLNFLLEKRGFVLDTIEKFKLGFDGDRIYIPIVDEDNYLVNIRKYLPEFLRKGKQDKMLSYKEGAGEARLFPEFNLNQDTLVLLEGEMDTMLCHQLGMPAITVTSGAGSWKDTFTTRLAGKTIYICYDIDKPGQLGMDKIAKILSKTCKVKKIVLPITEPKGADFTNYIVDLGNTIEDFKQLIDETKFFSRPTYTGEATDDDTYKLVSLIDAAKEKNYFKNIEMNVVVSGKDLAPYFAPVRVDLLCGMGTKQCRNCGIYHAGGTMEIKFSTKTQDVLQLINCTDAIQKAIICKRANIAKCNNFKMKIKEVVNVEELRVIPELDYHSNDTEYVTRQVYYVGYGIQANKSYKMRGVTLPDPKTQYVTQIITEALPAMTSIDNFVMTPEIYADLKIFQSEDIKEKMDDIHTDLSNNVTRIYGRNDLLTAIDLVFHSVLTFKFQGQTVQKGWTECLIIGDTRCGKTETAQQIIKHYRLGELCTGENISYAGLVGGMQQTQKRWSISWGKIPLNDRHLLILDEISTMQIDFIGNLSGLRSSGIAEIIKINNERTNARTRLLWMANPRSGNKLDTYNYGVHAVKELIGRSEDIARFDFAVTAASNEVSINVINAYKRKTVKHTYTSNLCHTLALWAWSRKQEHVIFLPETEDFIIEMAKELGGKYSPIIPLVEAAEQRIKIARLSVAVAARVFSTDETGNSIIVKPIHVQYVVEYLNEIYSKSSMGYDLLSMAYREAVNLSDDKRRRLTRDFCKFSEFEVLRELLLEHQTFRKMEIVDQMGYDMEQAKMLFKWLNRNKLARSTSAGYIKQPVFTNFLKNFKPTKTTTEEHQFNV